MKFVSILQNNASFQIISRDEPIQEEMNARFLRLEIHKHRIFTFAPCMLLHLFYLKPTHALFVKYTHIHI